MIISQETKRVYEPVTITFETKEELAAIISALGETSDNLRDSASEERYGIKPAGVFPLYSDMDDYLKSLR